MLKERTRGEKNHEMGKLSRPLAERRTRPALSPGAVPRLDGAWVGVVAGLLHPGCCCKKKIVFAAIYLSWASLQLARLRGEAVPWAVGSGGLPWEPQHLLAWG